MDQPDSAAYLIVDESHLKRPDFPLIKFIDGYETVEEMESALGIPSGNLVKTLNRYNEFAALGEDPGLPQTAGIPCAARQGTVGGLRPVTGQGHVFRLHRGGLATDVDGRVLRADGSAIPGFMRRGVLLDPGPGWQGYSSGTQLGSGSFFGRRAGGARGGSRHLTVESSGPVLCWAVLCARESGGGSVTATMPLCGSCGTAPARGCALCDACGSPLVATTETPAEFKHVTVLFADVVRSMDMAASLGPERLREIMAALFDCASEVVCRFGGTVDKFTGDGLMALFGAPVALENHAQQACRAALEITAAVGDLTDEVADRDGIDVRIRIGLNSGEVVAGESVRAQGLTPRSASRSGWHSGWNRWLLRTG